MVELRPHLRRAAPETESADESVTAEHARPQLMVENGQLVVRRSLTEPRRQTWLTVLV